jgi:hypothetical protein
MLASALTGWSAYCGERVAHPGHVPLVKEFSVSGLKTLGVRLCMLLLPLLCFGHQAESQEPGSTTDAPVQGSHNQQDSSLAPRSTRNLRFRCGVTPNDPANQTFNVAVDYYNEGHAVVWVKFRLGVQLDHSAPLYYDAASRQPLEPGKLQGYAVSVIKEEPAQRVEEHVPGSVPSTMVECKVDQVRICPVGIAAGSDSSLNSDKDLNCKPEPSFTEKFKLPPDKKWNCIDIDDGGRRCGIVARTAENCIATVCMGDMVWVTTSRQWFAFDGEDWISCLSDDANLDPQKVWGQCSDLIRKRQAGFTPGEYVPLPQSPATPTSERE